MSGQWEVVGKAKKANGNKQKLSKTDKKKFIENAPKIEDILPLAQVKTLYTALDKEAKPKIVKQEKKQDEPKKIAPKKNDKPKETIAKPQKHKSIESALTAVEVDQIKSIITVCQTRFSDSSLIWLKEVTTHLNSKLNVDNVDPVFSNRPLDYPLSAVPQPLHETLQDLITKSGSSNCHLFFELCLTNITNEMTKGSNALGYKIIAQLLAFTNPKICIANLAKFAIQRTSYQNRAPIGQSLLWTLGQGGVKDLTIGLKVWLDIMVPVLDMKNYSKFVLDYLSTILNKHKSSGKNISNDLFVQVFDVLNTPRIGFSKDLIKQIEEQRIILKEIMFKDHKKTNTNYSALFPMLLSGLNSKLSEEGKKHMADSLVKCLKLQSECYNAFIDCYSQNIVQSAYLIEYINKNWYNGLDVLGKSKQFQSVVKSFQTSNEEFSTGKKKEGVQQSSRACEALLEKMAKKKETSFVWKVTKVFLFMFLLIGLVAAYDFSTYKSFETSLHGQFLTKTGLLPIAEKAGDRFLIYSARGYKWAERNLPEYYNHTALLAQPYLKLASDVVLTGRNVAVDIYGNVNEYVREKIPTVVSTINEYAPGLLDTIQKHSANTWSTVSGFCVQYFDIGRDYLKTKIFVGQLSPENLHKVTLEAYNTTQQYASQYYSWLYEKVDAYSKLK